jgi:shikimate kinase
MSLCEKILIAGFSGAGKSSFLRALEQTAPDEWGDFADLDELVLKNTRPRYARLSDLISDQGWEKFRLWERQQLEGWAKTEGKGVLALGGGTLSPVVLEMYKSARKIKIVFLKADFETCWQRILSDTKHPRPLVQKGKAELAKIYQERLKIFESLSLTVDNPHGSDLLGMAQKFWNDLLHS